VEDLVRELEEEYGKSIRQSRRIAEENKREELPGRYMAKMLYGWDDRRFDQECWGWLERNWLR